ncbi:HTH-type transcriptional repressor RspR [Paenibacillus plantiphilus]|uniref:HTH-type transcriptional repressor RspR n=1 Tax=Paenibacillus plantiphilus TaxID=2905650 RepID=A0ABM9CKY9_9BACL|nr:GntR family transcriptional regulator [Paenibacillus plantiphilus]CAH1217410.1 HTH-type transcriptional repressor RspR [Paenibacillus plantiphilus]
MEHSKTAGAAPLLKDIAYDAIKERILDERFEPGRFLSERELIELLEMSKTPIKSALTRLETEGFVTVSSKQGIIINDLTLNRIVDIYDLRLALETFNIQAIVGRLTQEQGSLLLDNLRETEEIVGRLDIKAFAQADHQFHLLLCRFAGNQEIYRVLLNYQDHLLRITLRHLRKDPVRMVGFYQDHVEIYELLQQGKKESVERLRDHLQQAKSKLFM